MGAFLENCGHSFLDNGKNFTKTKFQKNFIGLRTVGAPRSLEDVAKRAKIW